MTFPEDPRQIFLDANKAAHEIGKQMSPSERLQVMADTGAWARQFGPPSENFEEFTNHLIKVEAIDTELLYADPAAFRELAHSIHMSARWAEYGFNVFDLSSDLAAGLMLTEPVPVPEDGFKLPFPSFAVRIPEGIVPMFVEDEEKTTRQIWADTMWVHQCTGRHAATNTETTFLRVMVVGSTTQLWRDRFPTKLDDEHDETIYNRAMYGDPPTVPEDSVTVAAMMRLFKNFMSWLHATAALKNARRPQPPHLKKKASKEARHRVDTGAWPHIWILGHEVKLARELRDAARDVALGATRHAKEGWKVRIRFVVQGHYHTYHVGPGRTETVVKWLQPYWKGPEDAAAWSHLYEDEKAKKS